MDWLIDSGHAADIVIVILGLEAYWLIRTGRMDIGATFMLLVPAILMMLALRFALTGAYWPWIAAPLAMSFPVHLADLRRRGVLG